MSSTGRGIKGGLPGARGLCGTRGRLAVALVLAGLMLPLALAWTAPLQIEPVERPEQFPGPRVSASLVQASNLVRATQARTEFGIDGSGLAAAVLDTGLRTSHVDFAGRVPAWRNFTGGDPNDVHDANGHGTNCAGIIAAHGDHTGIAPGASIVPLKVLNDSGSGDFEWIRSALDWVIANHSSYNITVVSMSLGAGVNYTSFGSDDLRTRITTLRGLKIAVVIAAGNSYWLYEPAQGMGYPAIIPECVSVGAVYDANIGSCSYGGAVASTTGPDRFCPFSQRLHESVGGAFRTDVFAPGAALTSSGIANDHGESTMHGTSQATPVTAGCILLLQQHYLRLRGTLPTVDEIESLLRTKGKMIVDGDDEDDNVTNTGLSFPRVDIREAAAAVGGVPTGDTFEPDNVQAQAKDIPVNGAAQYHTLNPAGDVDWAKFAATAGVAYTLQTAQHSGQGATDTVLVLYDAAGNQLAMNDDISYPSNTFSRISWTCPTAGTYCLQVRHFSSSETGHYDLSVTAAASYQPDAMVKNSSESAYSGDGIYNSDGTSQNRSQTPTGTAAAVYFVKVQNDADRTDNLRVSGTGGGSGWAVKYLKVSDGADITSAVTGSGWAAGAWGAGSSFEIRVEVSADSTVAGGTAKTVDVKAISVSDPTRSDTVRLTTTKPSGGTDPSVTPRDPKLRADRLASDPTKADIVIAKSPDDPRACTHYIVYRLCTTPVGRWEEVARITASGKAVYLLRNSGLVAANGYRYGVRALNGWKTSALVQVALVSGAVNPSVTPRAPGLAATRVAGDATQADVTITHSPDDPGGCTHYVVYRLCTSPTGSWVEVAGIIATGAGSYTVRDTGLVATSTYRYGVRAMNGYKTSALITAPLSGGTASVPLTVNAVAAPTPAGGAQVALTLSCEAQVTVTVMNIAGVPIKRVCTDRLVSAGASTVLWDGRTDRGPKAPAGRYIVQVNAHRGDGSQMQSMATVSIGR